MSTIYKYLCAMIIIGSSYVSCAMVESLQPKISAQIRLSRIFSSDYHQETYVQETYVLGLLSSTDAVFTLPTSVWRYISPKCCDGLPSSRSPTIPEMTEVINKINRQGRYKMPELDQIITECSNHLREKIMDGAPKDNILFYICKVYGYKSDDIDKIAIVFYHDENTDRNPIVFPPEKHLDISIVQDVGSITVPEGGFIVKVAPERKTIDLDELD